MSVFTNSELAYLQNRHLGRLATSGRGCRPHVIPVTYQYNAKHDTIDIGGAGNFAGSKKYRDAQFNPHIAFVVDDTDIPGHPHFIEIRGDAETMPVGGKSILPHFADAMIRLIPTRIISWGINGDEGNANSFRPSARSVPSTR